MTRPRLPVLLLAIAAAGIIVLLPGVNGPFLFDDYSNFAQTVAFDVENWTWADIKRAALTNGAGPTGRPVSMFTFAVNAALFGLDPFAFKLTNILLHAICAVFMTLLALRVFSHARNPAPRYWPLLVGLAWSVHPIAITSTLYTVQRMNLLAALFVVLALLAYLRGREHLFRSPARAAGWAAIGLLSWVLGIFSKENALLLPAYVFLVEWLVLGFRDHQGRINTRWRRFVLTLAAAGTLVAIALVGIMYWDAWMRGFEGRSFTLAERLLTESRVAWDYIGMVLVPWHSRLGLFLDDITLSTGLFNPVSTFFAIGGLVALLAGALALRKRLPLASFGVLFFLAGHILESTVVPLEIAFEHRNYLPSFGLLLALGALLSQLVRRTGHALVPVTVMCVLVVYFGILTTIRSLHWSDDYMHAQLEAFYHPRSARAESALGGVYMRFALRSSQNEDKGWTRFYFEEAAVHLEKAAELDRNAITPLLLWYTFAKTLDQSYPADLKERILDRLRNAQPSAGTPGALNTLFTCLEMACQALAPDLEQFLHAALANPELRGRERSEIMVIAAKYFRDVKREPEWALYWFARAAENARHILRFRVFLARQLVAMGRHKEALEEIERITQADAGGLYSQQLAELKSQIRQN